MTFILAVPCLGATASPAAGECVGDCDRNGRVSLTELVQGVDIALGKGSVADCTAFDVGDDDRISIAELLEGVVSVLSDCGRRVVVRGVCQRPGPGKLVPCAEGTPIRVGVCQNQERCLDDPAARVTIEFGALGAQGAFRVALDPAVIAGKTLVYEADVEPATSTVYRVLDYGQLAGGSGSGVSEEVVIDPNTEAAVQLIDETGLENLSPQGVADIIDAVQAANADLSFAGVAAASAASMAADHAREAPAVIAAIQEAMVTPTPTSTATPTATRRPNVLFVTNVDDDSVSVIGEPENTVIDTIDVGSRPIGMALTPDRSHALVVNQGSSDSESFSIIDTRTHEVVQTLPDYEPDIPDEPLDVAITPAGRAYVANRASGSVDVIDVNRALIDPASARVTRIGGVGLEPSSVAAATSKPFVYIGLVAGKGVAVINTSNNQVETTVDLPDQAFALALAPGDETLYVTSPPGNVSVIDTENNPPIVIDTITVGSAPFGIAVAPAGDFVYVANAGSGSESLSIIASSSRIVGPSVPLPAGSLPTFVAVAPDGRSVYVPLSGSNLLAIIDTALAQTKPAEALTMAATGASPQEVVVVEPPGD